MKIPEHKLLLKPHTYTIYIVCVDFWWWLHFKSATHPFLLFSIQWISTQSNDTYLIKVVNHYYYFQGGIANSDLTDFDVYKLCCSHQLFFWSIPLQPVIAMGIRQSVYLIQMCTEILETQVEEFVSTVLITHLGGSVKAVGCFTTKYLGYLLMIQTFVKVLTIISNRQISVILCTI